MVVAGDRRPRVTAASDELVVGGRRGPLAWHPMRRLALGVAMTLALVAACFSGDSTLGSICREDADCGGEQTCENEVCGHCGDAEAQPGELCSVEAAELGSAPQLAAGPLLAFDRERDGTIELVVRGEDGIVELWQGDGESGFTVATRVPEGGNAGPVRLVDLDADDDADVVVVDAEARTIGLVYSDAEGNLEYVQAAVLDAAPLDLAVAGAWEALPAWVTWVDELGLWYAEVDPEARTLGEPTQLAGARAQWLGDSVVLDDDDRLDLVVLDVDGMVLEPWLGSATGLQQAEPVALEQRATDVLTFDIEGDGDSDVLLPDEAGGITVVVDVGGALQDIGRVEVPGAVQGITVADLDRDVDRDLVVAVDAEPPLWLFPLRSGWYRDSIALPATGGVGAVRGLDIDGDGLVELVLGPSEGVGSLRVVEVEP